MLSYWEKIHLIKEHNLLLHVLLNTNVADIKILKYNLKANMGEIFANVLSSKGWMKNRRKSLYCLPYRHSAQWVIHLRVVCHFLSLKLVFFPVQEAVGRLNGYA